MEHACFIFRKKKITEISDLCTSLRTVQLTLSYASIDFKFMWLQSHVTYICVQIEYKIAHKKANTNIKTHIHWYDQKKTKIPTAFSTFL